MRTMLMWLSGEDGVAARQRLQSCVAVAAITLLARLPFLIQPGLSIDSYFGVRALPDMANLLRQGRFGQYAVLTGAQALGIDPQVVGTLLQGVGLACFAATVPLLFTAFSTRPVPRIGVILASLVVTLHPFSAEILTFPEASFTAQLATAMAIAATFMVARQPRRMWLGVLLLVIALSMYQMLLNYVGLMLLFGAIQALLGEDPPGTARRHRLRPLWAPAVMVIGGVVLYLLLNRLVLASLGLEPTGRSQLLALADARTRVVELGRLSIWLWKTPFIVHDAPAAGVLLWATALAGWAGFVAWVLIRRPGQAVACLALAALIPLGGIGVVAVSASWWPVPRVLGGIVVVWAMGIYWLFALGRRSWIGWVAAPSVALMLLGAAAVGHRIHLDQITLNGFDGHLAAEIFRSLNRLPGYTDRTHVAIVNRNMQWAHTLPLSTAYMDMNMTAFAMTGAQQGVLQMTVGREVIVVEPMADHAAACDAIPFWPSAGFTTLIPSGDAVVCL